MTARAWTFTRNGSPQDILTLAKDLPIPSAQPPVPLPKDIKQPEEWILVKTAYASLNPGGLFHMSLVPAMARAKRAIPEMDLSGTVLDVWTPDSCSATESTTPRFKKDDAVVAFLPITHTYPTGTGALSSHVSIPARYAVRKPESVSFRDAAGLMLAACTAWQLILDAGVKEGDRVLINGGSGGIGTFAVQLARYVVGEKGFVVAVCSGKDGRLDLMKDLGADEAIDYTPHRPLSPELSRRFSSAPFSAILDTVGVQDIYAHSASYLVEGGTYTAVGIKPLSFAFWHFFRAVIQMQLNAWWPLSPWLGGTGRRWKGVAMFDPGLELMEFLTGLMSEGKLRTVVDSVWEMDSVLAGYKVLEGGHAKGKVVIKIGDDVD